MHGLCQVNLLLELEWSIEVMERSLIEASKHLRGEVVTNLLHKRGRIYRKDIRAPLGEAVEHGDMSLLTAVVTNLRSNLEEMRFCLRFALRVASITGQVSPSPPGRLMHGC